MFFNEWSGATSLIMFLPSLIEEINDDAKESGDDEFPITPL